VEGISDGEHESTRGNFDVKTRLNFDVKAELKAYSKPAWELLVKRLSNTRMSEALMPAVDTHVWGGLGKRASVN
jgi:hypothetical protein